MKCPMCGSDTKVGNSRQSDTGDRVTRQRICISESCMNRCETIEVVAVYTVAEGSNRRSGFPKQVTRDTKPEVIEQEDGTKITVLPERKKRKYTKKHPRFFKGGSEVKDLLAPGYAKVVGPLTIEKTEENPDRWGVVDPVIVPPEPENTTKTVITNGSGTHEVITRTYPVDQRTIDIPPALFKSPRVLQTPIIPETRIAKPYVKPKEEEEKPKFVPHRQLHKHKPKKKKEPKKLPPGQIPNHLLDKASLAAKRFGVRRQTNEDPPGDDLESYLKG